MSIASSTSTVPTWCRTWSTPEATLLTEGDIQAIRRRLIANGIDHSFWFILSDHNQEQEGRERQQRDRDDALQHVLSTGFWDDRRIGSDGHMREYSPDPLIPPISPPKFTETKFDWDDCSD